MSVDWHERWAEGRIGFHLDEVNPHLLAHAAALGEGGRVLVPLCGKSRDLTWLAARGFDVVGVELVEQAAREYFAERGLVPEVEDGVFRAGGVELRVADVFDLELAPVDAVWDRAALIALPPEDRARYAARILGWLKPGGALLLVSLDYEGDDGPPYAVSDDEVRALYGAAGELTLLAKNAAEGPPRLQGREVRESVWRFQG